MSQWGKEKFWLFLKSWYLWDKILVGVHYHYLFLIRLLTSVPESIKSSFISTNLNRRLPTCSEVRTNDSQQRLLDPDPQQQGVMQGEDSELSSRITRIIFSFRKLGKKNTRYWYLGKQPFCVWIPTLTIKI